MDKKAFIAESLDESAEVKILTIEKCTESILKAAELINESFRSGGKMLLCGNGGSAADCQHIAAEFMIRLCHDLNRPAIPAIALTTDTSNLTAGGNDIGYENVFARNVEGLGNNGDVLIAISTSGNSGNIIKAVQMAKMRGVKSIGFLGGTGGELAEMVDLAIVVPSEITQRIQETHITIGHILCEVVERELYGDCKIEDEEQ